MLFATQKNTRLANQGLFMNKWVPFISAMYLGKFPIVNQSSEL